MAVSVVALKDDVLDRLEAAAIDGRARNVRYRQNQLHLLHRYFREHADSFCSAIRQDEQITKEEAELEFYLTMTTIVDIYEQLNFKESIEQEYALSKLKNNTNRRVPYGIVLIKPGTYNRFFSIISPLATALGAGNCVLIEILPTIRSLDFILQDGLKTLDHEICAISSTPITNDVFLSKCLTIHQTVTTAKPSPNVLISNPQTPVLAVVARTADIEKAAKAIVISRCAFRGRSPHSPDIVLVNEFVKKDFIKACLEQITAFSAALSSNPSTRSSKGTWDQPYPDDSFNMIFETNMIKFLELQESQIISRKKIASRAIIIASITGLIDAVTIASNIGPLAACYYFADVKSAKFLSQHIDGRVAFVNQIPAHLLVGPAFPSSAGRLNPDFRYEMDMVSLSRPEQVMLSNPQLQEASDYLFEDSQNRIQLRDKANTPLKPTGQASGSSMGFFDQGILTGFFAFVLPSVGLLGFSIYKIVRLGLRYYYS